MDAPSKLSKDDLQKLIDGYSPGEPSLDWNEGTEVTIPETIAQKDGKPNVRGLGFMLRKKGYKLRTRKSDGKVFAFPMTDAELKARDG